MPLGSIQVWKGGVGVCCWKFSGLFQAWHALLNLHVHPPISGNCAKVVLGNNLFGYDGKGNFHILVPVHRCVLNKKLMSNVRNWALGVDTILLSRQLFVVRLAQDVVVTPENPVFCHHK